MEKTSNLKKLFQGELRFDLLFDGVPLGLDRRFRQTEGLILIPKKF